MYDIEDIVMDDVMVEQYNDDKVYDLMDRAIATGSTKGLPAGIYIYQGRKVHVK